MRIVSCQLLFALSLLLLSHSAIGYELILVRHFEKIADVDDPGLTKKGHARAENLAEVLDQSGINRIYTTDYNRTKQTAMPVAELKGFTVNYYDPRNLKNFAVDLLARQESALIVGHSNTTPALIKLLGGEAKIIGEKDYGEVFFIRIDKSQLKQSSILVPIK